MVFYCQRNSYATNLLAKVVSCKAVKILLPSKAPVESNTKSKASKGVEVDCFEVIFEDTVFFPEGGGQPDDLGVVVLCSCPHRRGTTAKTSNSVDNVTSRVTKLLLQPVKPVETGCQSDAASQSPETIDQSADVGYQTVKHVDKSAVCNMAARHVLSDLEWSDALLKESCSSCSANVLRVTRKGSEAIHYLDKPLQTGDEVQQLVLWSRRKDHMQQHSGQHLITALADAIFGYATTSWNLGSTVSTIELNTRSLTEDQLRLLEERVSAVVCAALPVTVTEYLPGDPALNERIRSRGLPTDHTGPVRVVSIAGLDANMCCGTHIGNTSQLQTVKLLHFEPGKQGKTLLYFVAGDRTVRTFGEHYCVQRSVSSLLSCSLQQQPEMLRKLQASQKSVDKCSKEALKDLAVAQAELFKLRKQGECEGRLWCLHRQQADMDYLMALVSAIDDESVLKIFTAGKDKGPGVLLIHGLPDHITAVAAQICAVLDGKGGGKSRFTGKVNALHRREEAYKIARNYLESL